MRRNWKNYRIQDIATIYDGPHATPKPSNEGPIFLGIKNLTDDGRFDFSGIRHISTEDFPKWTQRVLPSKDDIVFVYEATLHRYGLITENMICCLGRRMGLLRLNKNVVFPKFLLYYFQSTEWKQIIEQNTIVGATVNRISLNEMPDFPLYLPDLKTQQKIASVLSALDAKIELNNRINAELEAMAKTLYDYWFVQFDFPDANGKPYKTSGGKMVWNEELKREIPEGWEVGNLLKLSDLIGGGTPSKTNEEYWNGDIPFYTPTDYTNSVFTTTTQNFITKDGLDNCSTALFPKGTIFITARGTVGNVTIASTETAMNQSCYAFCPKLNVDYSFIYFSVKSLINILKAKSGGSVFNSIVSNDIKQAKLAIPPINLIKKFGNIGCPIFEKIHANVKENQQLVSLRDWLLPMLMNGQVTVGEVEKAVYQAEEEARMAAEPADGLKKDFANPTKQEDFLWKLMLASHIVYELCDEPTFGHTKLMKLLYLSEQIGDMALQTNYKKAAAGPFDGRTLNLIDQEYKKNKWFTLEKRSYTVNDQQREATVYKKTEKSLCYKKHFDNYFGQESDSINKLISLFRNEKTQTAEIVATLYFAWKELLAKKTNISESLLIKAFYDFHEEKKKFNKEQILDGYRYMLTNGIHP